MDEIVRVVNALMLSAEKSVATPANWCVWAVGVGMRVCRFALLAFCHGTPSCVGWKQLAVISMLVPMSAVVPQHTVCYQVLLRLDDVAPAWLG